MVRKVRKSDKEPIKNMTGFLIGRFNSNFGEQCVTKYKNPVAIALFEGLVTKLEKQAAQTTG
jgi:hypothetical protein